MRRWIAVFVLLACASQARANLTINGFDQTKHDRFYSGPGRAFIGESYDFSAVGRSGGTWGTLITPTYFVSANHFHPGIGNLIAFYPGNDNTAAPVTATVLSGGSIAGTDLWLGKLTAAVNTSLIHPVPILDVSDDDAADLPIWVYGVGADNPARHDRLGTNVIDVTELINVGGTIGDSLLYEYNTGAGPNEAFIESGDSGAPTFVDVNGTLALIGLHWAHDNTSDPMLSADTFVSPYITPLQSQITSGPLATIVELPEPSAAFVLLVGAACTVIRRRRIAR